MVKLGRGTRPPNASAYVMLSRVCQLNPLILVERFSFSDIKHCQPTPDINRFWKSIQILREFSIFDNAKFEGLVWRVPAACCHLVYFTILPLDIRSSGCGVRVGIWCVLPLVKPAVEEKLKSRH